MRFRHLDLNLLYALDMLLEERNITRAGERLHISQSTMSGVLKRLRDYFEDDLLVRQGHQMQPTPLAMDLQGPLREIILNLKTTILDQQEFEPAHSKRHLRIISSDYAVTVFFREAYKKIAKLAPNLSFEFLSPSETSSQLFVRGDLDFMLVPDHYLIEGHPNEFIFQEEYICVVWEGNTRVENTLSFAQYQELGHVTVSFGINQIFSFEEWLMKNHQISRRLEVIGNDFNTLPQLVIGTDLVATMHKRLAEYYAQYLPIKLMKTPMELPVMKEYLAWHRTMENDPLHRWVKEQLFECAQLYCR